EILAIAGIVDGVRPGVVHGGGQAVPTVDLQAALQGVVSRVAGGFLHVNVEQAVVEIAGRKNAGVRQAPEVGLVDRSLRRLIDVAETEELVTIGADIADLQHGMLAELLLEVEVEVLHVGRAQVLVHAESIGEAEAGYLEDGNSGSDGCAKDTQLFEIVKGAVGGSGGKVRAEG